MVESGERGKTWEWEGKRRKRGMRGIEREIGSKVKGKAREGKRGGGGRRGVGKQRCEWCL